MWLFVLLVVPSLICRTLGVRVLDDPPLDCSLKEVRCKVNISKIFDRSWIKEQQYTPSGPVDLTVGVDVRRDGDGDLVPVLDIRWKARDDGSIQSLNGTEVEILTVSNNDRLYVRYVFFDRFKTMRDSNNELWSFSLNRVVVAPEKTYHVAVSNLPRPNIGQTNYNLNQIITVPDCMDSNLKKTKICFETGSHWEPNITMVKIKEAGNRASLYVEFNSGGLAEKYKLFLKCDGNKQSDTLLETRGKKLNATFDLQKWPHTCCLFDVQIQPVFPKCANDCVRKQRTVNICSDPTPHSPDNSPKIWLIALGVFLLICGVAVCIVYSNCRGKEKDAADHHLKERVGEIETGPLPSRSVLVIYSKDHPLYVDIVLKLCGFLRAKCGTDVVLDLLDTSWLGCVGPLPWLEQQKRRMEESSNKILLLCSRGVQAKWGAMCGEPPLTLREDTRSPTGDILTPALNLMLTDIQRAAPYGKYMVAYFEDVSDEGDVPSMFDPAVKYKLMKHFEELYFRILDMEKYQQGQIRTIRGIGVDEYLKCPSGKQLRDAIETFQAHQLENPDWFERECMDVEDEPRVEMSPLLDQLAYPVLERVPVINKGPPVLFHDVEIHSEDQIQHVYSQIPQLHGELESPSVLQCDPVVQPGCEPVHSVLPTVLLPPGILVADVCPSPLNQACIMTDPSVLEPPQMKENMPLEQGEQEAAWNPAEVTEGQSSTSFCRPSPEDLQRLMELQLSLMPFELTGPGGGVAEGVHTPPPPQGMGLSLPVEMEENELVELSGNGSSRGSDQGYISKDSFDRGEPQRSSLAALARLQESLLLKSPVSSGFGTEITGAGEAEPSYHDTLEERAGMTLSREI